MKLHADVPKITPKTFIFARNNACIRRSGDFIFPKHTPDMALYIIEGSVYMTYFYDTAVAPNADGRTRIAYINGKKFHNSLMKMLRHSVGSPWH